MSVKTVVCQFCKSTFINEKATTSVNNQQDEDESLSVGKTVFARWEGNGFYYPAVIAGLFDNSIKAAFLDGDSAMVSVEFVLPLREAFATLAFQGNWKNAGLFFKGTVANQDPLIMNYNDGDVEIVELSQLRGARPGEKTKRFFGLF